MNKFYKYFAQFSLCSFCVLFFNQSSRAAMDLPAFVKENAPILVQRRDQVKNPDRDVPIALAYSIFFGALGESNLIYSYYFTDKHSLHDKEAVERQMGAYGRHLDIEWAYRVDFNAITGAVSGKYYQCPVFLGIGERKCNFNGKYDSATGRPILYNVARHNVFSERPSFPLGDRNGKKIVLDAKYPVPAPSGRELVLFKNPSLVEQSDILLEKEGRLIAPGTEYLYIRIQGGLKGKGFWVGVQDPQTGTIYWSGDHEKKSRLQKMGYELWSQESYVGIRIPEALKKEILAGQSHLQFLFSPFNSKVQFNLIHIGAYLINATSSGYQTADVSPQIHCAVQNQLATCSMK